MKRYVEKQIKRYIVATLEDPVRYLVVENGEVSFVKDIGRCTKAVSEQTATYIKDLFYVKTKRTDIELAIIPLNITYELICENETIEGSNDGFIS